MGFLKLKERRLRRVIENGDSAEALRIIENGNYGDINYHKLYRDNVIIAAINSKMPEVALRILDIAEWELNTHNPGSVLNAFDAACSFKMIDVALKIIESGRLDLEYYNWYVNTPLMAVCRRGLSELAMAILKAGKCNVGKANGEGNTALIKACETKMSNVALKILRTGKSNPGQVNEYEVTALMYACNNKMIRVAMSILNKRNCNSDYIAKSHGKCALYYACSNNLTNVALKIIKVGNLESYGKGTLLNILKICVRNNMNSVREKLESVLYRRVRIPIEEQKLISYDLSFICIVCRGYRKDNYTIVPCGHMDICGVCAHALKNKCPKCKELVGSVLRLQR